MTKLLTKPSASADCGFRRCWTAPARGPPQHDLGFDADPGFDIDQTPAYDLTDLEPVPDFDFDQSAGA
jgi:hypothetical protein